MKDSFDYVKRPSISRFATWAKMNKPFTKEKHYLCGKRVCFDVTEGEEYANHIEMSGYYSSAIISYGADENGSLRRFNHVVFPSLRMYPNDTYGSFDYNFQSVSVRCDGVDVDEKAVSFIFDGILHIRTKTSGLHINRSLFVAPNVRAFIEMIEIENQSGKALTLQMVNNETEQITKAEHGYLGRRYKTFVQVDATPFTVENGQKEILWVAYCATMLEEVVKIDCQQEYKKRIDFLGEISERFVVETPDNTINIMAHYAKIRAAESVFKTKSGLMHSPGGGNYYAALWTNDQCEYVNPFFANLGYRVAIEQSLNCYELYKKYISPDKALITSIIAEGDGVWHGAGDRGDSAMYAYGCSRFLLALGEKKESERFIGSIEDCLTYTISQINEQGVVNSDSDELENRFESGNANLSTSCLAYDAFVSTAYLEKELGRKDKFKLYMNEAEKLKKAIGNYFGKAVEGYDTYMYCTTESNLRSWICLPLVVGIHERAQQTVKALLSGRLRLAEGLLTRSGEKIFWDRTTLYALRGIFYAGFADEALELLSVYSRARVLGEHIPYAVEAFPEGNQAQLSAESGLYLRIFTEGILGYRPVGFHKFEIAPNLPTEWDKIQIKNITIGGKIADIGIERKNGIYRLKLKTGDKVIEAEMEKKIGVGL